MKHALFVCLLGFPALLLMASEQEASPTPDLKETITRMDAAMFDAFNAHDAERIMNLFTDDLEFYHDTGGLTNYPETSENFRKLFANVPDIKRTLVPGSLEVYPIKDYGAVEIGAHRFCHMEKGQEDCGTFRFLHVWRRNGDGWKVARVVSYGH